MGDEISTIDNGIIDGKIKENLKYFVQDIEKSGLDSSCSDLRSKLSKHHATIEDLVVLLNQQSTERDIVLSAIKTSKNSAAVSNN